MNNDFREIDFFVVGAQKCATSWLYYCLQDHPQVHVPPKKREDAYLGGDLHAERGDKWFYDLLGDPENRAVVGDISVDYLFDPRSPRAVQERTSNARLVLSLRDPIDRAVSAYYWHVRRGNIAEMNPSVGLRKALRAWQERPHLERYEPGNAYHNVIARGMYAPQLERYIDAFTTDQLLVLRYEDIKARPEAVLKSVYAFLEVDASHVPGALHRRPKQNSYFPLLLRLQHRAPNNRLVGKLSDVAHQEIGRAHV